MRRPLFSVAALLCAAGCLLWAAEDSPVADAAMRGQRAVVRSLLEQGADVNAAQGDGMTALHWAARQADLETAQMLIFAGANIRATTRIGGYTPLLLASQTGDAGVVGALLKAGADAKSATGAGATALMLASASGKVEAVRALLAAGADVGAKDPVRHETPLIFATAANRIDVMKLLIASGADVKGATKVTDLKAQTNPEEEEFLRGQRARGAQAARGLPAEALAKAGAQSPAAGPIGRGPDVAGLTRQFRFAELVSTQGGLAPLHFAVRHGYAEGARLLLASGADVNQVTGDGTTPLLMATINGHFDLAKQLLDAGANPRLASDNGVTPLYAALNVQWAPKSLYPQPRAHTQQKLTHLDLMKALLDKGADVNARLRRKVWYSGYNFDLSGVDEIGGTPFWRAAYASDVEAMRLLVAAGADPNIPTIKPAGRPRTGDAGARDDVSDVSALPPVPTGGPGVPPLHAASGVGYGEGYAANSHMNAPTGWLPAIKYLVEKLGADVNVKDHDGNTALHHAAARGDNEVILYLVAKGADVMAVNRSGETTLDMANGPVQRIQPFPETIALLAKLGAKNNNRCKSC